MLESLALIPRGPIIHRMKYGKAMSVAAMLVFGAMAAVSVWAAGQDAPASQPASSASAPASAPASVPAGMAVLELKLPKPVFKETPKDFRMANLDTAKRGVFLAPKGCVNLAAGRPVTASDTEPTTGTLAQLTDGDKEAAEGAVVEFGPGKQWVQVDLGAARELHAIVFWHYHGSPRVYQDVVVQVSSDADFVSGVRTLYNNDADNSSGLGLGSDKLYVDTYEGKLVDGAGVKARYVRLYSSGSSADQMNHYIEIEVWGK
jgi:hypothetical protein